MGQSFFLETLRLSAVLACTREQGLTGSGLESCDRGFWPPERRKTAGPRRGLGGAGQRVFQGTVRTGR